jgi:hypothetical protein
MEAPKRALVSLLFCQRAGISTAELDPAQSIVRVLLACFSLGLPELGWMSEDASEK